ncbi:MAG: VCBS repeat-containing protein, partial [Candidatus Latescibacterota bacterium]|nr:VCBS repeat-containing protein [Candidatus Latescibacterota bacterium]
MRFGRHVDMTVSRVYHLALSCVIAIHAGDTALAQEFTDVAEQAGIGYQHSGFMYIGGIAIADFDDDGFQDIYVTTGEGYPNLLYLNDQDGTFAERASSSRIADMSEGWGAVAGDLDNDGDPDIYLTNYFSENKLFLN